MAATPRMSNVAARNALEAALKLLDAQGAASPGGGYVEIRTGAPPTNVEDAATGTLLATLQLSNPAFAPPVDANPGAIATAYAISPDTSADATNTAGWFRAYDASGNGVIQGTVGTASSDFILNTVSITAGQQVSCTSWTVTLPET